MNTKNPIKFSRAEVDAIIKEEAQRMVEKRKLMKQLNETRSLLNKMNQEDKTLLEVEAGGEMKVASHAWTGKENGDVKNKPIFQKKGTHLMEDGMEDEMGGNAESEMGGNVEAGMGGNVEAEDSFTSFEAELAKVGKRIDMALGGGEMGGSEAPIEVGADEKNPEAEGGFETIEIEDNPEAEKNPEAESNVEKPKEEAPLEEAGENTKKGLEPMEGESPVQEAPENKVVGNLSKSTDVKEESKKLYGTILSEGMDVTKKNRLSEQILRNRRLAGLTSDPDGLDIIKG